MVLVYSQMVPDYNHMQGPRLYSRGPRPKSHTWSWFIVKWSQTIITCMVQVETPMVPDQSHMDGPSLQSNGPTDNNHMHGSNLWSHMVKVKWSKFTVTCMINK